VKKEIQAEWLIRGEEIRIFKAQFSSRIEGLRKLVIAIDGPAASGKSTTARLTAQRLQYLHIDTGAMYRAMTWKVLRGGIDPADAVAVADLARRTSVRLALRDGRLVVFLDDIDVTEEIRLPEVTKAVSEVSCLAAVREVMVREQRHLGKDGGVVLEGRDIGTVVFPDADLKIFLVADVRERARRRQIELGEHGYEADLDAIEQELVARDTFDSNRPISPLKKAADAILLDTSHLSIGEQVAFIVDKALKILDDQEQENR
jgi:CMP/dCMP kinase